MAVSPTKVTVLTGAYQRLCTVYHANNTTRIPIGDTSANKVIITALTKALDISWGETDPVAVGHQIGIGDSMTLSGLDVIALAWVRNTVVADVSTIVITPFQEFE